MDDSKKSYKVRAQEKYTIMTYILFFFCFSIIGWIWEVTLYLVRNGRLLKCGVMLGPWLPIYGVSGLLVLLFLKRFYKRPVVTFILATILVSVIEYITSFILEKLFNLRWWDYSGFLLNINGRICVESSILFGLACCVVIYFLAPFLNNIFKKVRPSLQLVLCITLISMFSIDLIYSKFNPNIGPGRKPTTEEKNKNQK